MLDQQLKSEENRELPIGTVDKPDQTMQNVETINILV